MLFSFFYTACNSTIPISVVDCVVYDIYMPRYEIVRKGINPLLDNLIVIKGKAIDHNDQIVIGVAFYLGSSEQVKTYTDLDGQFEMIFEKGAIDSNYLHVRYVGAKDLSLKLEEVKNSELKISYFFESN